MMGQYARNPIVKNYLYKLEERQRPLDTTQWYHVHTKALPDELRGKFELSSFDAGTEDFVMKCYEKSDWIFTQIFHNMLRFIFGFFMSMTTVNGMLNRGSMFVCSHANYRSLLDLSDGLKKESWIDLGAGDGKVTQSLLQYFTRSYATEQSPTMRWRLEEKGFQLEDIDKWKSWQYDLITALNLIDRIDQPWQLLQDIRASVKPDGMVLLAVVLPYEPCYERGTSFGPPSQRLPIQGRSIEEQIESFVYDVLYPAGFDLIRFTKVPYLCEGDLHHDFFRLTDILFVLKPTADVNTSPVPV